MVVFETDRLIVRPWTHSESDERRLFDIYSRWEVSRWLGSVPTPLTDPAQATRTVDRWATQGSDDRRYGIWAVQRRDNGQLAGTVLLKPLPEPAAGHSVLAGRQLSGGEVEVGWHLHPDSWGHGYATEAARGAVARGFAGGLTEIYAVVRAGNEASMAVCRRLGMATLGVTNRWYGVELEAFRITAGDGAGDGLETMAR